MNTMRLFFPLPVWNTPDSTTPPPQTPAPVVEPPPAQAVGTTPTSEDRQPLDAGWTPYTPDPNKSAQENLALKEAYDKRAPEGHDPNQPLAAKPGYQPPQPQQQNQPPQQQEPAPLVQLTDLVAPEGFEIDPNLGTEFIQLVNQNHANPKALVNELIKLQAKAQTQASETASQEWDNLQAEWKKQSEADPEIGGANYAKNTATATDIVRRFGGPTMQEVLETTGMGNHPEFLRFITKIAPFLTEAQPVSPAAPAAHSAGYSRTNLYPEQDKK